MWLRGVNKMVEGIIRVAVNGCWSHGTSRLRKKNGDDLRSITRLMTSRLMAGFI